MSYFNPHNSLAMKNWHVARQDYVSWSLFNCKPRLLEILCSGLLKLTKKKKSRKNVRGWEGRRGDRDVRDCLAQQFFAHSSDKGLSVLLASHSGRRPHDSLVPISRVTPELQHSLREAPAPGLFCLLLSFCKRTPHFNPLPPNCSLSGATVSNSHEDLGFSAGLSSAIMWFYSICNVHMLYIKVLSLL